MIKIPAITLPLAPQGWFDYKFYLLSDGTLAVLRADRDINGQHQAWRNNNMVGPNPNYLIENGRLSVINAEGESSYINLPSVIFPLVDRFPDGRWLVAASRAGREDKNGMVLHADGRPLSSFHLGDGIEHIRCSQDGTIWAGYFDEGVYGETIGQSGIAQFTPNGEQVWMYNDPVGSRPLFVDDCYALTLNGNELWACFYSDFPIMRIVDGRETFWRNTLSGAKALAVENSFVLLAGGYGADKTRLSLLKCDGERAHIIGSCNRPEFENAALLQGQSSAIHIVKSGRVDPNYRF
ncbi:hypothetical protein [Aestuariivirga sp.]|uniref:hypothetical protein n=1 Tax=Aestuariivirga sp. TaxID=2650926 RepID=UPI0039E2EE72